MPQWSWTAGAGTAGCRLMANSVTLLIEGVFACLLTACWRSMPRASRSWHSEACPASWMRERRSTSNRWAKQRKQRKNTPWAWMRGQLRIKGHMGQLGIKPREYQPATSNRWVVFLAVPGQPARTAAPPIYNSRHPARRSLPVCQTRRPPIQSPTSAHVLFYDKYNQTSDILLFFCVAQLDKAMACVEDIDRGEPAGFKQRCDDALLLTVRSRSGTNPAACKPRAALAGAGQREGMVGIDVCTSSLHLIFSTAASLPAPLPGAHAACFVPLTCAALVTHPCHSCAPTSAAPWRTCCARSRRRAARRGSCG